MYGGCGLATHKFNLNTICCECLYTCPAALSQVDVLEIRRQGLIGLVRKVGVTQVGGGLFQLRRLGNRGSWIKGLFRQPGVMIYYGVQAGGAGTGCSSTGCRKVCTDCTPYMAQQQKCSTVQWGM
jgi:hypothetical protein